MSKAAFRSMLETSVTVSQPVQYFTFDKVPKEATWEAHASSPINARITAQSTVGRTASSRAVDSAIFGRYPEADFVLYYDVDDIVLEASRTYRFEWTDSGGTTRVAVSMGPAEEMGGMSGYMRIPIVEWFRYVE